MPPTAEPADINREEMRAKLEALRRREQDRYVTVRVRYRDGRTVEDCVPLSWVRDTVYWSDGTVAWFVRQSANDVYEYREKWL
jgi:hypothetical protein